MFPGPEFCGARAGLPWECGVVPAVMWTLSRRWWQGDVFVSLLQGMGGLQVLPGEKQWEPWQGVVTSCLQRCSCRAPSVLLWDTAHSLQLLAMGRVVVPWGVLPALPCKWRKDLSFSSLFVVSVEFLCLLHSPALPGWFWLEEAKQSPAAVVLLYLHVLQHDARHSLPSGSKNTAVAAVCFKSKVLIASSGTLLTRIKIKYCIFLLKNCFLLYFAWSAEVGKFLSTRAKTVNYWLHQAWISILGGKKPMLF